MYLETYLDTHSDFTIDPNSNGVDWSKPIIENKRLIIWANNITTAKTNQSTGLHATVHVGLEDKVLKSQDMLAYDTFNITKSRERLYLANSAHKSASNTLREEYSADNIRQDLDHFCAWLDKNWEVNRYSIQEFDPTATVPPLAFDLHPYLLKAGGTILFGPPGSGKSWITMLMATSIANGLGHLWSIEESRPVLFINLERPSHTLALRDAGMRRAFELPGSSNVHYLHARGASLVGIMPKVKTFVAEHPNAVLFLDSVSRSQSGKLNDDITANNFVDLMNSTQATWCGIGHTPRDDNSHIYGSVHFEAGEDIGVRVSTLSRTNHGMILSLEIDKANDMAQKIGKQYYELMFDSRGLIEAREVSSDRLEELGINE